MGHRGARLFRHTHPSGRLLRRSSNPEDRPARRLFAAQFALSHACWLATYPLSGWLMTAYGALAALTGLSALAFCGAVLALLLWPNPDPVAIPHRHDDLPPRFTRTCAVSTNTFILT